MYSTDMESTSSRYRCRACGSASYQRLTHRIAAGAMGYSGMHRCSGCSLTFATLQDWHGDGRPATRAESALSPSHQPMPHNA
jgi:rubredoxin